MTTAARSLVRSVFYGCILLAATLAYLPSAIAAAPELLDISIVEIAGRPGHLGVFPIQGLPIQGTTAIARVQLDGSAAGMTLNVRAGNLLSKIPMLVPAEGSAVAGTYFVEFTVPNGPFSLTASGIDSSGTSFEVPATSSAVTLSPQTLDVRVIPTVAELAPGLPTLFTVQVTNRGAASTMTVALASDAGGTVTPPSTQLTLDAQQTKGVTFTFTPPSTVEMGAMVTMKATAARITPPSSQNEASLALFISPIPQAPLLSWPNPNARLGTTDQDPTFIWICNGNVDGRTIELAYGLVPDTSKTIPRQDELAQNGADTSNPNRNSCTASSLLKVSFDTGQLRSVLATTVFPSQETASGKLITVPISAYATDGTKFVGYVPLSQK
ncbi:MAG: hypothetical protein U0223_15450 [Nitrospira sp.]|nr:hypothetical protein [Nitrospira sp.]